MKASKKKNQTAPTSPQVAWERFMKKYSALILKQTPAYSVARHYRNFKQVQTD